MFRTLLTYSTTSISQSGQFSLQLNADCDVSRIILSFWSGNVFNCYVIAEILNSLVTPKEILQSIGSFLAVFPTVPPL